MPQHELETSAGRVRWDAAGDGPAVILVHGTPWSSFAWHRVAPLLQQHFRVYWYDLPGYGASEMDAGQKVSLDVQGTVFAELVEHWGLARPFVVGHDFGGAITLRAHLLHGVDYGRYILMNAVALAPWGSPFFAHVRAHAPAFAGMPGYIHKAVVRAYIESALAAPLAEDYMAGLIAPWTTEAGQAAFYRQIAAADQRYTDEVEPLYPQIRCPTLVIWGGDDPWIPLAKGEALHQLIPGSKFRILANAGHLVPLDAPREVAEIVTGFLSCDTEMVNAPCS